MSNLEDFFAKKDKKRSRTKPNYLAADELYRTLEETSKMADGASLAGKRPGSETSVNRESNANDASALEFKICFADDGANGEEDEWSDFTEENSNLCMGRLRSAHAAIPASSGSDSGSDQVELNEVTNNAGGRLAASAGDGIAIGQEPSSSQVCPWQKKDVGSPLPPTPQQPAAAPPPSVKAEMTPKKQIYVPPALRQKHGDGMSNNKAGQRVNKPSTSHRLPSAFPKLNKSQAPDLNSAEFFPSLSSIRAFKRAK